MKFQIENKNNPAVDFERIANSLMSDHVLCAGDKMYQLIDIEFYYNNAISHPDIYAHNHELQKEHGKWYFHGSGIDITFGEKDAAGGILIRGMKKLFEDKKQFIDGPLKCVQEIFTNFGLVDDQAGKIFYLKKIAHDNIPLCEKQEAHKCRRVGINEVKDTGDTKFYNKYYRFFIYPKAPHSEKYNIAKDLVDQNKSKEDINTLFGYNYFKINK